jgi:hypothetical protein
MDAIHAFASSEDTAMLANGARMTDFGELRPRACRAELAVARRMSK